MDVENIKSSSRELPTEMDLERMPCVIVDCNACGSSRGHASRRCFISTDRNRDEVAEKRNRKLEPDGQEDEGTSKA